MDDLYHTDVYAWSRRQATVLRDLGSRRDLPNDFDLEHVAEEIEDVGNSELNAVKSFLRQCLLHIVKAACSPRQALAPGWGEEAIRFRSDALDRLTPSMPGLIDIDAIWRRAVHDAEASLALYDEHFPRSLPPECPFSFEEITGSSFDIGQAIARLRQAPPDADPAAGHP